MIAVSLDAIQPARLVGLVVRSLMDISFYKIRSFRSDFVLVNQGGSQEFSTHIAPQIAKTLCQRRYGVGAKGLIVVSPTEGSESKLTVFDKAGKCVHETLDALLCGVRYLFDSGQNSGDKVSITTNDRSCRFTALDSNQFEIDLGTPASPILEKAMDSSPSHDFNTSFLFENKRYIVTPVSLGIVCSVLFITQPLRELRALDRRFKTEKSVGDSIRAYLRPRSPDELRIYTWPTEATADYSSIAACCAVAAISNGFGEEFVTVSIGRDRAYAEWSPKTNSVRVSGGASYVFSGDYYFEDDEI